jgi:hypothetical protein
MKFDRKLYNETNPEHVRRVIELDPFAIETKFKICIFAKKCSIQTPEVRCKFSIQTNVLRHNCRAIIKNLGTKMLRIG